MLTPLPPQSVSLYKPFSEFVDDNGEENIEIKKWFRKVMEALVDV